MQLYRIPFLKFVVILALENDLTDLKRISVFFRFLNRDRSFYLCLYELFLQITLIVLTAALFVMSLYDMIFSKREGGDPTKVTVPVEARTYGNPGFRERRVPANSKYTHPPSQLSM